MAFQMNESSFFIIDFRNLVLIVLSTTFNVYFSFLFLIADDTV